MLMVCFKLYSIKGRFQRKPLDDVNFVLTETKLDTWHTLNKTETSNFRTRMNKFE